MGDIELDNYDKDNLKLKFNIALNLSDLGGLADQMNENGEGIQQNIGKKFLTTKKMSLVTISFIKGIKDRYKVSP